MIPPLSVFPSLAVVCVFTNDTCGSTPRKEVISAKSIRFCLSWYSSYVEGGSASGVAGNMVHEFGHNMGLDHNWVTPNKGDDGATNYMGYGAIKNQMSGFQLNQASLKYKFGDLNQGQNYEILKQDYNTNGRTTQQMPLQYNVGRGGKIPRTLKN